MKEAPSTVSHAGKSPTPYPHQNESIWSRSEKAIVRTVLDAALGREVHEVIQEAKRMANEIQKSSDLWNLEHDLTQRRKEIDRKYDYRYSQLTDVFGRLLHENRLGGRAAWLTRGQAEVYPFFRQILSEGRGLTCILSAIAYYQQLTFYRKMRLLNNYQMPVRPIMDEWTLEVCGSGVAGNTRPIEE
jgi:hypothetical protein